MNCKKAEEQLVEFLYQELSASKTVEIEKHLSTCTKCAATLESWRAIHHGYQGANEAPEPTPYLRQRIMAIAKEEMGRPPSFAERAMLFLKLGAIPVSIFALVMLFNLPWKTPRMAQKETIAPAPVLESKQEAGQITRSDDYRTADKKAEVESKMKSAKRDLSVTQPARSDAPAEALEKDAPVSGVFDGMRARDEERTQQPPPAAAPASPAKEEPPVQGMTEGGAAKLGSEDQMSNEPAKTILKQKAASVASVSEKNAFLNSQIAFQNGNPKEGRDWANVAVNEDSKKSLAPQWHQSGVQFQNQGEHAVAIVQFNLVLDNYRNYNETPDVLLRLGDSYAQLGRFAEAKTAYEELRRYPNRQKTADERLIQLGKKQQADEQLRSLGYVKQE